MKTRIRKWKHYRSAIERSPEGTFPAPTQARKEALSERDRQELNSLSASKKAIVYEGGVAVKGAPYVKYRKRRRSLLLWKLALLALAIGGLAAFYFFFVIKGV